MGFLTCHFLCFYDLNKATLIACPSPIHSSAHTLTENAGLVHVFDLDLATQIFYLSMSDMFGRSNVGRMIEVKYMNESCNAC